MPFYFAIMYLNNWEMFRTHFSQLPIIGKCSKLQIISFVDFYNFVFASLRASVSRP